MKKACIFLILFLFSGNVFSQNTDIRILRTLHSSQSLPPDGFFRFVSDSHGYIAFAAPVTVGVAGFIRGDDVMKKNALEIAESIVLSIGVTQAAKYIIYRERPFITYPDITKKASASFPSFPSGHTSTAFATATSLSLTYPEWYIIVPSFAWASTVGYSRLHLGVHYPSDVLGGAIIGSGCAWLTHFVNKKLNQRVLMKNNRTDNQ